MTDRLVNRNAGFTLLEVIIAMALVAILSAISVLSLAFYIPGLRLKSAAQEINVQIQKARLEAIRTSRTCHVEFYRVIDGITYGPVVWVDDDDDSALDANEIIFRVELVEGSPGVWEVRQYGGIRYNNAFGGDGATFAGNRLSFNQRGVSDKSGSVHLINARGQTRQILVTLGGAVRVF